MSELLAAGSDEGQVLNPALGWGNPSSSHVFGLAAKAKLEHARTQIATCVGAKESKDVIMTSGASESINHAILGACLFGKQQALKRGEKEWPNHIVTSTIEHVVVHETIQNLVDHHGFQCTKVNVDEHGRVDPAEAAKAVTEQTAIVSIMLANNEIGTVQPLAEIASMCKEANPETLIHTDASQAVGKVKVDLAALKVDLLTIAGHKFYGPKGVGALVGNASSRGRLAKLVHGAPHEVNQRAGTENVLLAVGLGAACERVTSLLHEEMGFLEGLRNKLQDELVGACGDLEIEFNINGNIDARLPNTLSISFADLPASELLDMIAPRVACSAGAACHTGKVVLSHVLEATRLPRYLAEGTLRFSVGRFSTLQQVMEASAVVREALGTLKKSKALRKLSEENNLDLLPATQRDYWKDTYQFQGEAVVLSVRPDDRAQDADDIDPTSKLIILDRTLFHPQGGGQPSDTGTIVCEATQAVFQVEQAVNMGKIIYHYGRFKPSGPAEFAIGSSVALTINSEDRKLHARLHSAGHLLDIGMALCGMDLPATKGCHFPGSASVDYKGTVPAEERAALKEKLEEKVNGLIQQGLPTQVLSMSPDEAADALGKERSAIASDESEEPVRIVVLGGSKEGCPCGGTHVQNTREIKGITIRKLQNKKGDLRVSYSVEE